MRASFYVALSVLTFTAFSCNSDDDTSSNPPVDTTVNFQYKSTINVGGEGAAEISAFDPNTNKLFIVNTESDWISVYDISNLDAPVAGTPIDVSGFGAPNSVAIHDGKLAIALEASVKQNPGKIALYNTDNQTLIQEYTVGALPDMVTFTKDGAYLLSANEGEPNDAYTVDPNGSVSIIDLSDNSVTTLDFTGFNGQEASLEAHGFRVFGPNADLAADVEPEYIAVSDDSKTAWVSLQENNGIAKVNLESKAITDIYPLGFKDYNDPANPIDASDQDDEKTLKNWPVYGMYQPDAIAAARINGVDYIFSANEGDARDYDGFSEEDRCDDLVLDPSVFPDSEAYQNDNKLGRLKITTTLGDTDNDGEFEAIYNYGARSFSVWSANGALVYDSGSSISTETLNATPDRFNDNDKRSDDKGAEPEAVVVMNIANERYILFVGLERNDQVLVYDVTNPTAPSFMSILSHAGDEAPEGLWVIPAEDSPNGKALLVVSNEDSGTVSFYENQQ